MIKQRLDDYRAPIEKVLQNCLQEEGVPEELLESMNYSLQAGGKRIRPVLCLVWAELLGQKKENVLHFCSSLELIHTYSLIHDDLPAMDNDDLRRGKASNHIRFGEALAILAGDGLLTRAFSMMLQSNLAPEAVLQAAGQISRAAGPAGMVGGQVLDMTLSGNKKMELEKLKEMHSRKTGAMIKSSCLAGAILARGGQEDQLRAEEYGAALGLAFQVADDILDITGDEARLGKPVGSDQARDKLTYPALLGLDESRRLGLEMVARAKQAIETYSGIQADFLRDLAGYIMDRVE
ncbi:MAG: polyprenyl synthetase family protein [Desulfohalobiaceae bacterium]|nr:polyprenyl synthetase family protein [Desulfohalobiaceae bacterium]